MKKLLLVVAMLLIASPVMATVSVTATDKGAGVVEVRYNCSANERVRSFALDISVNSGLTIDSISDFNVGESNSVKKGYGIFPGTFADWINPASPNWANPNYTPVAPVGDPNAQTGLGTSAITVEMGSLFVGDANRPPSSGLLFKLGINPHGAGSGNLSIVLNNTRVGVVLEDTNIVASPVLTGTNVTFGCTLPNVISQPEATATAAITAAGFTLGNRTTANDNTIAAGNVISTNPAAGDQTCGIAVDYVVSLGSLCTVPNVVNALPVDANTAIVNAGFVVGTATYDWSATIAKGKLISSNPASGAAPGCGATVTYVISQGLTPVACFDPCTAATAQRTAYNGYITNKWDPNCWCEYPIGSGFQCHGDADGKATAAPNSYRIYTGDMSLVTGNWQKKAGVFPLGASPCADIDHKTTAAPNSYKVYTGDLARVTANWQRKGCTSGTGTLIPRNCPLNDTKNNATYVAPTSCADGK
mgnify:CR=1 FL=1